MKMVKSLILGSAAGLLAMSGAQAADLPVKAKAVEYVKICSLYGAGFYYIPGTDTCIKLGGYLRVDLTLNGTDYSPGLTSVPASNNRLTNYYYSRSRSDFTIDTRTATEYGVVRTFADMVFSWTTGAYTGSAPGAFSDTLAGAVGGSSIGGASLGLYHAFIQFAGFTLGRTVSAFDAPWQSYPAGGPDTLPGGSNHVTGVNQATYTAQFGNGVSGTISVQDPTLQDTTNIPNLSYFGAGTAANGTFGTNSFGGTRAPDVIGKIAVDQAWGLAQLSVVGHDNHVSYYGTTESTGHPDDKWGWAVAGALSIKNIPTGPGDVINMQAVYTDGASRYNFQSLMPTSFAIYSGTGLAGAYQSIGIGLVSDAVYSGTTAATGTQLETVKTWGFRGGYTHNWNPNWASAIYGAYGAVQYGSGAKAGICANFVTLLALTGTCNPDFNFAVIGFNTVWTPVKGFAFTADVNWTHLDQKFSGTIAAPAIVSTSKPAALYELKDQNAVSMLLRAQRNW
jgi:Porin subfamily